jgi:hypothetical protein
MPLELVENGDNGLEVRNKINDTITAVNGLGFGAGTPIGEPLLGDEILGAFDGLNLVGVTSRQLAGQASRYFFHGFAGNQIAGDPVFYDISGAENHGAFGASLSNAAAFGNAGFISTVNPVSAGGLTDSVIRMPGLNFDYVGGEKLILWWLGKCTAEGGATTAMMGDGFSNTRPGLRIRMTTAGLVDIAIGDVASGQLVSGGSPAVVGDGNLHSFAIVLMGDDGGANAKKYQIWVDEAVGTTLTPAYLTAFSGSTRDTKNSNTWNIGTSDPASAATQEGLIVQTRALAMLRLGRNDVVPELAEMTAIFKALRANPGARILENALS